MKNKYILLFLFGFFGIHASAQTLAQAKILYEKGQYEQAKPVFKKFVKSQPNNGNYNLWYGVCCLNTGEAEEAIKYLETAVKRRVTTTAKGFIYFLQNIYLIVAIVIGKTYDFSFTHAQGNIPVV